MSVKFRPVFSITPTIVQCLMRIEAAKQRVMDWSLTPTVLKKLREIARLCATHYSTMIEGNRLTQDEVNRVIEKGRKFPNRERDVCEVRGYYAALERMEQYVAQNRPVTENVIQVLHRLIMGDGRSLIDSMSYRDGQNVIRDGTTGSIVYLPPEAHDVPALMRNLVYWIREQESLPRPIVAAIAHYQFATIHPYYDGNGRTSRLLTTLLLHKGGYDLKGLYALEEYYAQDLAGYYDAISIGPSHNYYFGRAEADITHWIEYFCEGMAQACEKVVGHMLDTQESGAKDLSHLLRLLDAKQRRVLALFKENESVPSRLIGDLFGYKPRTASGLCKKWVESGFLETMNLSKKGRSYRLSEQFSALLEE